MKRFLQDVPYVRKSRCFPDKEFVTIKRKWASVMVKSS